MEIKKHAVIGCTHHMRFNVGCHHCLVDSVVRLCEILENHPEIAELDPPAATKSLDEVFQGTAITQFTNGWVTNVTALPVTNEDVLDGTIRYTVEFRPAK